MAKFKKYSFFYKLLLFIAIILFLIIISEIRHFFVTKNFFLEYAPDTLSTCDRISAIPADWYCEDQWQESERNLYAFPNLNQKNKQFIRLRIESPKKPELKSSCLFSFPVAALPILTSASGAGWPQICLGREGFLYRIGWTQDGSQFELTTKGLPYQYLLTNTDSPQLPPTSFMVLMTLEMLQDYYQTQYNNLYQQLNQTQFAMTRHHQTQLTIINPVFPPKEDSTLTLSNQKWCTQSTEGKLQLNEKVYLFATPLNIEEIRAHRQDFNKQINIYHDTSADFQNRSLAEKQLIPLAVLFTQLSHPQTCEVTLSLKDYQLEPGEYTVFTSVNFLQQYFEQKLIVQ